MNSQKKGEQLLEATICHAYRLNFYLFLFHFLLLFTLFFPLSLSLSPLNLGDERETLAFWPHVSGLDTQSAFARLQATTWIRAVACFFLRHVNSFHVLFHVLKDARLTKAEIAFIESISRVWQNASSDSRKQSNADDLCVCVCVCVWKISLVPCGKYNFIWYIWLWAIQNHSQSENSNDGEKWKYKNTGIQKTSKQIVWQ